MSTMSATFFMFRAILLSLIMTLAFSWLSIQLAVRIKLIDVPGILPHKQHRRPTPLAGGLALLATLYVGAALFGLWEDYNVRVALLAGLVIFAFGIWDDFKRLSPLVKMLGQVLAAVVLIYLGVYVRIFESPEFFLQGSPQFNLYMDYLVTILWVVGITNAFNFVDSMDGLAVGLGAMAAAFFMLVTLDAQQPALSTHSALLVGVCIGLYLFNAPPALLFLGDSGAQTLGFFLAVLGITYTPLGANQSSSWFVPILLLGVPIFDAALVIFSRLRRGKHIYSASRDHTYHRLIGLGLDPFRAVVAMQMIALTLGCLAFVFLTQPPLAANIAFGVVLLAGVVTLVFLDSRKVQV